MEAPLDAAPRKILPLQACLLSCHCKEANLPSRSFGFAINLMLEDPGSQKECFRLMSVSAAHVRSLPSG